MLLKSVDPVVVERDSLLSFNPTYVLLSKESVKYEEKPSFEEKTRFHDLEVWEVQGLVGKHLFIGR